MATNSITQGEQVAQIWPTLFERYKLEIAFAHRTFAWGSDARGTAHVHVVIVGLTRRDMEPKEKRLFTYTRNKGEPIESRHMALSAYLFDASTIANRHLVVRRATAPLNGLPRLCVGSKPVDGGHYILNASERAELLSKEPGAAPFIRPFLGSREYLHSLERWILYLKDASPTQIKSMPEIYKRVAAVRQYRESSDGKLANSLARSPTLYHVDVVPKESFLAIPEVSSEVREYIPIGWLEPPTIPSNKLLIMPKAAKDIFGIFTSRMHMAWLSYIGGRLKSDPQYSGGIVFNTFPYPAINEAQRNEVTRLAQKILEARAAFPHSSLSDLYDPMAMPPELYKAHRALDAAVDKLYRPAPFKNDLERVEHLFGLYEKMVAPLTSQIAQQRKGKRPKAA